MCAIGIYELSVQALGEGVVVTGQSLQILEELFTEGRCVRHTVTEHKKTKW